ncbi:MAG: hypothetical protein PHI18_08905 [bacterium]|nr:hypothetical protein [bacterium]
MESPTGFETLIAVSALGFVAIYQAFLLCVLTRRMAEYFRLLFP